MMKPNPPSSSDSAPDRQVRFGLSWKLLLLTVLFVMVCEILIFVPSVANFRNTWLQDRLSTAEAAAVVLTASEWTDVPRAVQDDLLRAVGAEVIAIRSGEVSRLLATAEKPPAIEATTDLRERHPAEAVAEAMTTLVLPQPRVLRVIGSTARGDTLELVMKDGRLRAAMLQFSLSVLILSLVISVVTAACVFLALNRLLVRPMRRMSRAMVAFSQAPEEASRVIEPSGRSDEIGLAEEHLAIMQRDLQATLQHQRRLADLGLAVSKINHDLRNMLASAQLFSDRLGTLPDPTVQKFAPKLVTALDRAIAYCQSTLAYGKPREAAPERRLVTLARVVDEVAEVLGLDGAGALQWDNRVPARLEIDADPDQLMRILMNLCRNAMQAMESDREPAAVRRLTVEARRAGGVVSVRVHDTGPGLSQRARAHLFQAFQGSGKPGGTGLGLAIAAELVRAHGGTIALVESEGPGATFEIVIPDRPLEFARARSA